MENSIRTLLALSSSILTLANLHRELESVLQPHLEVLVRDLADFASQPLSPTACFDFEHRLQKCLRSLGRDLMEFTLNRLEGDDPSALPSHLSFEGIDYRLNRAKTKQPVDTLFGPIQLERHLYRPVDRESPESSIAPLSLSLGIVENATPALADKVGRSLAEAGATQGVVQERLQSEHGVSMGTGRLRNLAGHLAGELSAVRREQQVEQLLGWLAKAHESTGNRKPVLYVGRDGITLGLACKTSTIFEVASTATVTVLDRSGKRLGTVYLAYTPESKQVRLSAELTGLLEEVLRRWERPLPRLCYVTDAGDNETTYYDVVLRPMKHPRTGERLEWIRVVDFYHAMIRVWTMAGILFGEGTAKARGWATKMRKLLKKPNGPFRVLHSAAALRMKIRLNAKQAEAYETAYGYLQKRTQWMQYYKYKQCHVPLGSGLTESANKIIFTQRLKLSGMRWSREGAQVILDLRVALLSGIWDGAYQRVLKDYRMPQTGTPGHLENSRKPIAA